MKITTLIENNSKRELLAPQYGLSLFLETRHGCIVADTGQDGASLENFRTLGLDANAINAIFISHNHYDHLGGLQSYIDATSAKGPPVYLSADTRAPLVSKRFLHRRRPVSCGVLIEKNADRITPVSNMTEILPAVYACRVKAPDPDFFCKDRKLRMVGEDGRLIPDDFSHEIYLAVIEESAIKIVSPCSHNGVVNIIADAISRFELPVTAFVGGMHMRGRKSTSLNCPISYIKAVADRLAHNDCTFYTCHCTGHKAYRLLKDRLAERIHYFGTGDVFTV